MLWGKNNKSDRSIINTVIYVCLSNLTLVTDKPGITLYSKHHRADLFLSSGYTKISHTLMYRRDTSLNSTGIKVRNRMLILMQQQFPTSMSFFNYMMIEPNPVLNLTHSDSVKLPVAISKRT